MAASSLQRESLIQKLRNRGIRITAQRKALIESIEHATAHLDAVDLLEEARRRNPTVHRATVYRTLDLLKKQGLVDELDLMHLSGEKHYYEARPASSQIHLACFRCGAIAKFSSTLYDKLMEEIAASLAFRVEVSRFEVGGVCDRCFAIDTQPHPE